MLGGPTWELVVQIVDVGDEAVVRQQEAHAGQQHRKVDGVVAVIGRRLLRCCPATPGERRTSPLVAAARKGRSPPPWPPAPRPRHHTQTTEAITESHQTSWALSPQHPPSRPTSPSLWAIVTMATATVPYHHSGSIRPHNCGRQRHHISAIITTIRATAFISVAAVTMVAVTTTTTSIMATVVMDAVPLHGHSCPRHQNHVRGVPACV